MIENPAPVLPDPDAYADEGPPRKNRIAVKRYQTYKDPDAAFDSLIQTVNTHIVNVDAKLIEGRKNGKPIIRHYRNLREMMSSPSAKKRVRDAYNDRQLKELSERMVEASSGVALKEASFDLGLYEDEVSLNSDRVFRITDTVLPSTNSPMAKQQLWVDYLDSHRKCWEASVRNPIAKRIVKIIPQFVLGRGVHGSIKSKKHQDAWDSYWYENRMTIRSKQLLKELLVYGELFLRYFNTRDKGLVVRSLDPSTIWDIVTDPDDIENVQYYHQQYVITNQSPVIGQNLLPSTLIIRQIPASEIDHFKINSTSSEKRGRSELYAVLSWLLRFKEFANDRVTLNKMRSMFALDVAVEGDAGDLSAAEEQFATPPGPGAVLIHNAAITTEFKNANNNANEAKTDGELLLKIIAVGAGVSEQFLGVSGSSTRAGALIQTEPDVKNFEDYREIVEEMLYRASIRVFESKGLSSDKPGDMEFTFPSIAQEDRSAKLKDIAFSESMDWFSKERSATMASREFEITTYDYNSEKDHIRKERADSPVIATGLQQLPKVAPPEPGGDTPGLGSDLALANSSPMSHVSAQMGFKDDIGGRGLPNTKATLDRGSFTRGGEKASIQGNKSTGTPLRHAAADVVSSRGWNSKARDLSLMTRRLNKLRRLQTMREAAETAGAETKRYDIEIGVVQRLLEGQRGGDGS